MSIINIATEDELSEAVCIRLISSLKNPPQIELRLGRKGNGYLKTSMPKFIEMAQRGPMLLLTDLDANTCAPKLINDWLPPNKNHPNLIFRVAVTEVESWLLADHKNLAKLFNIKPDSLPREPDNLINPKLELLKFAAKAPSEIRKDLVAKKGSFSMQGLGYNDVLCRFVDGIWNPDHAEERSDSLKRLRFRLSEFYK